MQNEKLGGYAPGQTSILSSKNRSRLLFPTLLIVLVAAVGTVGYHVIEHWSFIDSLYMTVITMGTIGYGETHPLSPVGRAFTIFLIISSLGIAGYAISSFGAFIVEGELYNVIRGRRMDRRLTHIKNHIILCGGGRVGLAIADECYKTRTPFIIIEQDQAALQTITQIGDVLYLEGDATQDSTLRLAGIERASGLVAALGEDKDNVFIALSARALNPRLRIVSRVTDEKNTEKLLKAGADEVVSPTMIGGLRMASVMLRPTVVNFLDQMLRATDQTLRVEEIHVDRIAGLIGKTLAQANLRDRTGMLVVAIKPRGGTPQFNPNGQTLLQPGDILIVMGTPDQIAALHTDQASLTAPG
ncbi:MAG: potassium channel protein [Anaerolineae bacterium]|nr:potassium channel protein [Anaerolineae bacterium]